MRLPAEPSPEPCLHTCPGTSRPAPLNSGCSLHLCSADNGGSSKASRGSEVPEAEPESLTLSFIPLQRSWPYRDLKISRQHKKYGNTGGGDTFLFRKVNKGFKCSLFLTPQLSQVNLSHLKGHCDFCCFPVCSPLELFGQ